MLGSDGGGDQAAEDNRMIVLGSTHRGPIGDPAPVMVERSAEVDLLVLGSRGYGPVRRVLLGEVSGKVIRAAACPVVAVPRRAAPFTTSAAG